ncbi:MAG: hypothetical protein IPL76_07085 [Gemmatimonadetes bacterium]|nr:hypothetical protein [Gemmatimonadota bacterium]
MTTPEHLLRAGGCRCGSTSTRRSRPTLAAQVTAQIAVQRAEYEAYHRRHVAADQPPLDDWAKVVLVPGIGMITAFSDKKNAVTANLCYRAGLESLVNAEAVERFEFLPITREDLPQRQPEVKYIGAVQAMGRAARIMRRQARRVDRGVGLEGGGGAGQGGGGLRRSKAAMPQALRVAAVEPAGTASGSTPLTLTRSRRHCSCSSVKERAASRGITVEEQLEVYRKRNLMGRRSSPRRW